MPLCIPYHHRHKHQVHRRTEAERRIVLGDLGSGLRLLAAGLSLLAAGLSLLAAGLRKTRCSRADQDSRQPPWSPRIIHSSILLPFSQLFAAKAAVFIPWCEMSTIVHDVR